MWITKVIFLSAQKYQVSMCGKEHGKTIECFYSNLLLSRFRDKRATIVKFQMVQKIDNKTHISFKGYTCRVWVSWSATL